MSVHTNEICDEESLMISRTDKIIFAAIGERLVLLLLKKSKISQVQIYGFNYTRILMSLDQQKTMESQWSQKQTNNQTNNTFYLIGTFKGKNLMLT